MHGYLKQQQVCIHKCLFKEGNNHSKLVYLISSKTTKVFNFIFQNFCVLVISRFQWQNLVKGKSHTSFHTIVSKKNLCFLNLDFGEGVQVTPTHSRCTSEQKTGSCQLCVSVLMTRT